jgi:hypothetical protein
MATQYDVKMLCVMQVHVEAHTSRNVSIVRAI